MKVTLNNLAAQKSRQRRKIVGRGGKKGTYSGKGNKGQKARSGGSVRPGFEGGRTPLYRQIPKKRGFTSLAEKLMVMNVDQLAGNFEEGDQVTAETLSKKGLVKSGSGIKILGRGEISKKLIFKVEAVSASAKKKIEAAGGQVTIVGGKSKAGAKSKKTQVEEK